MVASVTSPNRINVYRVDGGLDEVGDALLYKYRPGANVQDTISIKIFGTFVGTVQVRTCQPGTAGPNVTDHYYVVNSYTAPATAVFEPGGALDIYLYCSAYTSGRMQVSLGK